MGLEDEFVFAPKAGLVFEEEEGVGEGARALAAAKALGGVREAFDFFGAVLLPEGSGAGVMGALRVGAIGRGEGAFSV